MTEHVDNNVALEDCNESDYRQYWSSIPTDADGLTGRALINLSTGHKMSVVGDNVVAGSGGIRETVWDHISVPGGYHFKNISLGSFIGTDGGNVKMQQQPMTWSAR
ncbi:hypothetical protein [Streptomyces sp. x-19]|uniref:hypothetical protein n=1 Tax=Streptomyces sp. x-19 TaxID=2789280 RepID=UPI00397ECEB8